MTLNRRSFVSASMGALGVQGLRGHLLKAWLLVGGVVYVRHCTLRCTDPKRITIRITGPFLLKPACPESELWRYVYRPHSYPRLQRVAA